MKSIVAILAGGLGSRLKSRAGALPKPMVPINGKPALEHQIKLCKKYGFNEIALLVGYRHEAIRDYFGNGNAFGVTLCYVIEENPLGTFGALKGALSVLADQFLVLYGDVFIDVDLAKLWLTHTSSGADGTLVLHPNDHPHDSDIVEIDAFNVVKQIHPYPHPIDFEARNLVNAALYVLNRRAVEATSCSEGDGDIAKHMFPKMIAMGNRLHGYVTPEYLKDMGTPRRLDQVECDIDMGLPDIFSGRSLRKAVFLDRDGTINREVNHLSSPAQLELLNGAAGAIRQLNRSGFLAIVITNQPIIARGEAGFDELQRIHARLDFKLGIEGAYLDGLYFCPHHPDRGFAGEVAEFKIVCSCRKPEIGLIEKASVDFGINRTDSWMVGDATSDIKAGHRAGVKTILLRSGLAGNDAKHVIRPDYTAYDLADAVEWILRGHVALSRRLAPVAIEASRGRRLVLIGGLARSGKSYAAQVLKELLHVIGHRAHVICLDAWLKPKSSRGEGIGVDKRFDLVAACGEIANVVASKSRIVFCEKIYDRMSGDFELRKLEHSIGPEDLLIIEGVPALLLENLDLFSSALKIFIEQDEAVRYQRLERDYAWRGISRDELSKILVTRALDEVPIINRSRAFADFIISSELN